ncbi:MAG: hypothetical protein AAB325_01650, partial [Pseudomonadota bacterium]
MIENSTPILVGCGDITDLTTPFERGRSPYELIAQAGQLKAGSPEYRSVVRDKGAMVFHMLRSAIGADYFNSLLKSYYTIF